MTYSKARLSLLFLYQAQIIQIEPVRGGVSEGGYACVPLFVTKPKILANRVRALGLGKTFALMSYSVK